MSVIAADDGEFGEAFPELFMVAYQVTYRILGDVTSAPIAAAAEPRPGHWPAGGGSAAWTTGTGGWRGWPATWPSTTSAARTAGATRPRPTVPWSSTARRWRSSAWPWARPWQGSTCQREVIALRYLADLDEAEVSRALGISVNSVKKHAARGKAALRSRLGPMQEVSLALD